MKFVINLHPMIVEDEYHRPLNRNELSLLSSAFARLLSNRQTGPLSCIESDEDYDSTQQLIESLAKKILELQGEGYAEEEEK